MRLLAGLVMGVAIFFVLYLATIRPSQHPLLIQAKADPWCNYTPQGPLLNNPRHNYDYQVGKRRTGVIA